MKFKQYSHRRKMRYVKRGYVTQGETRFPDTRCEERVSVVTRQIGFRMAERVRGAL